MNAKGEESKKCFECGYNCSQAVFCTFCKDLGMDKEAALKIASSFGGGMGRLREVCGSVSGMFMVLGFLKGYNQPDDYEEKKELLFNYLKLFMPWRKGPFNLAGIEIDTEWRSDWKWDRLKNHINLKDKKVLDIGTGSGYHLWRMLNSGASFVLGIEPYLRFCMQFEAIKSMTPKDKNVFMLPLTLEEMPIQQKAFDVIFSMGVLYHRKSPFDHLQQIRNMLSHNGTIVLETMIVDGDENTVFTPMNRYAKMHNVWFIPSVECCKKWLKKCGFCDIQVVDITKTTTSEQRKTAWMDWESLSDFLNPDDHNLTIENAPAPVRAIFIAQANN